MYKRALSVAITLTGLPLWALADNSTQHGFFEDSKASLTLRNFYVNTDNRDSSARSAGAQSKSEEWGQGFILNYTSGYTQGLVGFGVDAIGLLGIRLDTGGGTNGATATSYGGTIFPSDHDGSAVNQFSNLGLTAKVKISETELKLGTLIPKNPVIVSNDGRLLPQTWQGGQLTSSDIKNLSLVVGQIEAVKGRNSSNSENLSIGGANNNSHNAPGLSNKFIYAGGDYKLTKDLTAQYYYGNLKDFYKQNFLGLIYNWSIGPGVLKSDFRYFNSKSDGANRNGDPDYASTGYYGGNVTRGEVDNNLYSGLLLYTISGHTFGGGYQVTNGNSNFPWLNQGDGTSLGVITDLQIQKFGRAGEKAWQARYSYDFSKIGLPGTSATAIYVKGNDINTPSTSNATEWERNLTLAYVVPDGPMKGFGVTWRNAVWRNNIVGQRDQDENRVILSYTLPLL